MHRKNPLLAPLLVAAGIIVALAASMLPVNVRSLSPVLLQAAGEGTPSLAAFGRQLVDVEKIGPASMVLAAAQTVGDPQAPALATALGQLTARQPALAAWGGWDPFLDPIFHLRTATGRGRGQHAGRVLLPPRKKARTALHATLDQSGSQGVQDLMRLHELTATGRLRPRHPPRRPAARLRSSSSPAALYQSEDMSLLPHRCELREAAEAAAAKKELGELEPFFLDLLALGRRLDWVQLGELLRRTDSAKTVNEYAHLARVAPDQVPLIYAAALFTDSADRVATYLIDFGKAGADDLRLALGDGEGAVRQLLLRQVPVNHHAGPALSAAGTLVLVHPRLMLGLKVSRLPARDLPRPARPRLLDRDPGDRRPRRRLRPPDPGGPPRLPPRFAARRRDRALPAQGSARLRIPGPAPAARPPRLPRQGAPPLPLNQNSPWIPPPSYRSASSPFSRS